jgi:hypothetical protein
MNADSGLPVHSKRKLSTTAHPTKLPMMPQEALSQRSVPVKQIIRSDPRALHVASTSTSSRVLSSRAKRPAYQTPKSESVIGIIPRNPYPLEYDFPGISHYGCQTTMMPQKASSQRSVPVKQIIRSDPRALHVASTSTSSRALSLKAKRPAYQTSKSESVIGIIPRSPYPLEYDFPGISHYGCQTTPKPSYGVTSYKGNSPLPNLFDDTSTSNVRKEKLVSSVDVSPYNTRDFKKQKSNKKENVKSTSSRALSKTKRPAYQTSNKRTFTTAINSSSRTPTDKIHMSAIGAVMRYDKIEKARSVVIAVREKHRPVQESLERKLQAHEMGLLELRKIVDAWKGDTISLQKFEAVVVMKEKECDETRKLVAEARDKWGSAPRRLDATPTVLQKQSSTRRKLQKHSSSRSEKQSVTRRVVASCA